MSEARRIIENYAAENLPEEVSREIGMTRRVTVKVEDRPDQPRVMTFRGIGAYRNTSVEEAVARVRALRDDWD